MSDPLHHPELHTERKAQLPTEEKVNAILDLLGIIARALLRIFGKRKSDG